MANFTFCVRANHVLRVRAGALGNFCKHFVIALRSLTGLCEFRKICPNRKIFDQLAALQSCIAKNRQSLRGGVQGKFFWSSRFELWAPQVPLIIRETFGEILGPRRPTVFEPRPAQKLGVKYSYFPQIILEGQMGHQTVPHITLIRPI